MSNAEKMREDGLPVGRPFGPDNPPPGHGRPPGSRNIKNILRDLLEVPKKVKADDGSEHEVSRLEVICAKLVKMAEEGDLASIDRVFDRLEGKPEQANKNTNETTLKGQIVVATEADKELLDKIK